MGLGLAFAAIQKQPAAGRLLSQLVLHELKKQDNPVEIVPQYLVKSKEAVEPDAAARAVLRLVATRHPLAANLSFIMI